MSAISRIFLKATAILLFALPACSSLGKHERGPTSPEPPEPETAVEQVSPLPEADQLNETAPPQPTNDADLPAFDFLSHDQPKALLPLVDDHGPLTCLDRVDHVGAATCDLFKSLIYDFQNFYLDGTNLALLGGGVAVAAPLANTHADTGVRDWYQNQVRSPSTDHWSANAKIFGTYQTVIPIYLGAMVGGAWFPDTTTGVAVEDWASRTLRGMAVGAPAVGLGQIGLGSGRPGMGQSSHWSPDQNVHGVAGHAFVGAMPFLTAAAMVNNPWLKAPLVAASFATGWSRINDDDHYLSQVILGWWIAYLSVRSVNQTERRRPHLHFCPCTAGGPGVGILITH